MIRCLNFLIDKGMTITELVTDSSTSVASTLGKSIANVKCYAHCESTNLEKEYKNIHHLRDVWHKAKKLKKALSEVRSCVKNFYLVFSGQ